MHTLLEKNILYGFFKGSLDDQILLASKKGSNWKTHWVYFKGTHRRTIKELFFFFFDAPDPIKLLLAWSCFYPEVYKPLLQSETYNFLAILSSTSSCSYPKIYELLLFSGSHFHHKFLF